MISLDKDEHIHFAIRKHWFILFSEAFFLVLLIALPIGIYIALEWTQLTDLIVLSGSPIYLAITISSAWALVLWTAFFVVWTDYYLDMLILTNKKVIDIEQKGLFSRTVSTFRLERIQDISVDVHGILPTILGFGRIHIQTAGDDRDFVVKGLPRPYDTKDRILREIQEAHDRDRSYAGL